MSIVKMKRLKLSALTADRDKLMSRLQLFGEVEVADSIGKLEDEQWAEHLHRSRISLAEVRDHRATVQKAIKTLERYAPVKTSMFDPLPEVRAQDLFAPAFFEDTLAQASMVVGYSEQLDDLAAASQKLAASKASLIPWEALDLDLAAEETEHTALCFCTIASTVSLNDVCAALRETAPLAELIEASTDEQLHYLLLICHKEQKEEALKTLKPFGLTLVSTKGLSGTAAENIAEIDRKLKAFEEEKKQYLDLLTARKEEYGNFKMLFDRLNLDLARGESKERLLETEQTVFLEGWIPAEQTHALESLLSDFDCAYEFSDPTEEEMEEVPVKLKNNAFTEPLNMVTNMYIPPAYNGVDPNPLMAPFFVLFYGLMMADMGYGLLMVLGAVFMYKKMHVRDGMRNFAGLLLLCGISTFVWGALTGGFFGDFLTQLAKLINPEWNVTLPALFTPLTDTLLILIGSIALGVIQIVTGMTVSVVYKIRHGDWIDALFDEITWWIIIAGAVLAILGYGPAVLIVGVLMLAVGGTREAKGFGKLTSFVGKVYNGVSGYFSDTLSYARLMALMLAGAVIAQVFNTLGTVTGSVIGFVIVSMIGNALNFALNLLGCYVHDLRLQCLEFFGRFYKEGKKVFTPLTLKTKYVDIIKEDN